MKYLRFLAFASMLILGAACSKDSADVEMKKTVHVRIFAEAAGPDAKTTTEMVEVEPGVKVYKNSWEQGDVVGVFNDLDNTLAKFTATRSGATTELEGDLPEGAVPTFAFLPFNSKAGIEGEVVKTTIPRVQNGDFANVVLAGKKTGETAEGATFRFDAVCSIVKLTIPETVAFIDGETRTAEKIYSVDIFAESAITGDAKIDFSDETPVLTPNPNGDNSNLFNSITLIPDEGTLKDTYYLALFPILDQATLKVTLKFVSQSGKTAYLETSLKQASGKTGVLRTNVVKNLGTLSSIAYTAPTSGKLFSVSATKKIRFANGNLQYQASSGHYRFAQNQWDALDSIGNMTYPNYNGFTYIDEGERATQSEWIDLFRYGFSGCEYKGYSKGEGHLYPYDSSSDGVEIGNIANTDRDWGKFCDIINGNQVDTKGTWRLPTADEIDYLAGLSNPDYSPRCRTSENGKATKISATFKNAAGVTVTKEEDARFLRCYLTIGGEKRYGILLFPDEFIWPEGIEVPYVATEQVTTLAINYRNITNLQCPCYSLVEYARFEKAGVVFLPCAGYRNGYTPATHNEFILRERNLNGKYYTSSGYYFAFWNANVNCNNNVSGSSGCSVRLVQEVTE